MNIRKPIAHYASGVRLLESKRTQKTVIQLIEIYSEYIQRKSIVAKAHQCLVAPLYLQYCGGQRIFGNCGLVMQFLEYINVALGANFTWLLQ